MGSFILGGYGIFVKNQIAGNGVYGYVYGPISLMCKESIARGPVSAKRLTSDSLLAWCDLMIFPYGRLLPILFATR